MTPTLRVLATLTICIGMIGGTVLLDTNPALAGLAYLAAIACWFTLDKE